MTCPVCGTNVPDGVQFCPGCGTPVQQQGMPNQQQMNYGQQGMPNQQMNNGQPMNGFQAFGQQIFAQPTNQVYDMPMNWYKFLIFFALFFSAVMNIINGISTMAGAQYGGAFGASFVYAVFPGMRVLDILFGICCFGVSALDIVTRMKLAAFKKDGPKFITFIYLVNMALTILYVLIASIVIKSFAGSANLIINIAVSIGMIIANKIYFDKRAHMFVN